MLLQWAKELGELNKAESLFSFIVLINCILRASSTIASHIRNSGQFEPFISRQSMVQIVDYLIFSITRRLFCNRIVLA